MKVRLPLLACVFLLSASAGARAAEGKGFTFGSKTEPGVGAEAFYPTSSPGHPAKPSSEIATSAPAEAYDPPVEVLENESAVAIAATPDAVVDLPEPVGFGCPDDIGSFRFSDIYGRCEIAVPAPLPEPETDGKKKKEPKGPSLEEVRQSVIDRAIALAPAPDLRVAPGRVGLTGLPSFFWLGQEPQPITATAAVRGVTVSATAVPRQFTWSFGDGESLSTTHVGRRWTKRRDGSIEHTYETKGTYDLSASIVWSASWSLNDGAPQPLGTFTTTDSVDYPVREVVAFLTSD